MRDTDRHRGKSPNGTSYLRARAASDRISVSCSLLICRKTILMKMRIFAALLAILALCGAASAQDYHIRVNGRYNLRAAPGLDGRWVETAPTGTILHVIGKHNRWLKISRDSRELWMADWLDYTRLDSSAAAPASDIDNCCFVDRQCHSDWDWTVGYYAFLNNQCRMPGSGQPAASGGAPAASPAPTVAWTPSMTDGVKRLLANPAQDPFNNCCYMHHGTCNSDADWRRGYQQYQSRQCPHPSPTGQFPEVIGNAVFRKLVDDALGLMRAHVPEWLEYIKVSGVLRFEQLQNDVGGGFWNTEWMVGHSFYSWQLDDPNWSPNSDYVAGYAGGITHEACHAIKQRTYTQTVGWANELPCEEARYAVIKAIKPDSKDIGWLRDSVGDW